MTSSELPGELRRQRSRLDHANAHNTTACLTSILESLCKEGATKEIVSDSRQRSTHLRSSSSRVAATREGEGFGAFPAKLFMSTSSRPMLM